MNAQVKNLQETAETTVNTVTETTVNTAHKVTGTAHKAFQLGLGAVVVVSGEIVDMYHGMNEFADKLVERGGKIEEENKERVAGVWKERRNQTKETVSRVEDSINGRAEALINKMNLPTSNDIQSLNKQITSLSRKVDKMRKEQEAVAA